MCILNAFLIVLSLPADYEGLLHFEPHDVIGTGIYQLHGIFSMWFDFSITANQVERQ